MVHVATSCLQRGRASAAPKWNGDLGEAARGLAGAHRDSRSSPKIDLFLVGDSVLRDSTEREGDPRLEPPRTGGDLNTDLVRVALHLTRPR